MKTRSLAVKSPEAQLVTDWLEHLDLEVSSGALSQTTASTYQAGWRKFSAWLAAADVQRVSPDTIKTWRAGLLAAGNKPGSVNTWLAGVRAFFSWAHSEGLLLHDPTSKVKGIKINGAHKAHRKDVLTDAEVRAVLAVPDRSTPPGCRDYAVLCLLAYNGLRQVEVQRLDIEDVDSHDGLPVLHIRGKGHNDTDDLAVLASSQAQEALAAWLGERGSQPGPLFTSFSPRSKGERLSLSAIRGMVLASFRAAGVTGRRKTTHSLRHTCLSKIARQDLIKAQQVARHSDISTTMIYVHTANRLEDPGEALVDYSNGQ